MSAQYLVFVSVYAIALVIASLLVLTARGQSIMLHSMQELGRMVGVGPWGLLHTFGHEAPSSGLDLTQRAVHAESYIASAEAQTLHGAHVALWVLIAGCVACGLAAIVIIGILPPLVLSGRWSYDTYRGAAMLVVYGTAGGGLVMGAGLIGWLVRRTVGLNCTDSCAIAADLLTSTREAGLSPDLADVLATGSFPRLSRMLGHAAA